MCQVRPLRPLPSCSHQQHILTLIIHSGAPSPHSSSSSSVRQPTLYAQWKGEGGLSRVLLSGLKHMCVSKKVFLFLFFLCTYCLGRPSFFMKRLYPLCPFPKGARPAGSKRDLEKIVQSGMIAVKQQRQKKPLTQKAGRAYLGRRSGETDGTK